MSEQQSIPSEDGLRSLELSLGRDLFLRDLVRGLAGTLEEVVGLEQASGFFSSVGQDIGDTFNALYRDALAAPKLNLGQVAQVLVDLKRRIQGEFSIAELSEERIVLVNRACPFGDRVSGRKSMCMMTSNVFGTIAAENLGYARVTLDETIADGYAGCRVVIDLQPGDTALPSDMLRADTREYFGS